MTTSEELHDLEQCRLAAIGAADAAALREVLTEDYAHVHATGRVDDLDTYVDLMIAKPRTSKRGDISIRDYGDAAVLIGDQVNTIDGSTSVMVVSQVAVRQAGRWRFSLTHVARKSDS